MYVDSSEGWAHRGAILQAGYQWTGIGIYNGPNGPLIQTTSRPTSASARRRVHPAGDRRHQSAHRCERQLRQWDGDSDRRCRQPAERQRHGREPDHRGPSPASSFYANNIVEGPNQSFNTVPGTQTAPGIWTAQITLNPGDVCHAVAVDGSGNFTDITAPPPAVTLTAGANTVALPAAATATTTAMSMLARSTSSPASTPELAVTPRRRP